MGKRCKHPVPEQQPPPKRVLTGKQPPEARECGEYPDSAPHTPFPLLPGEVAVNAKLYEQLAQAWEVVSSHDVFKGIVNLNPLESASPSTDKSASGFMEAFNLEKFSVSLQKHGKYLAACNGLWANLFYNPSHGVPRRRQAIESLMSTVFADDSPPAKFPGDLIIGIEDEGINPLEHKGLLKRVSPEEPIYAAIFKIARGIQDGTMNKDHIEQWKWMFLTIPTEFVLISKQSDFSWAAKNLREKMGIDYEAMYPSAVQRVFDIAAYRTEREKATGMALTRDQIYDEYKANVVFTSTMAGQWSAAFVDTALTVWDGVLSQPEVRSVILETEEMGPDVTMGFSLQT